MMKPSTLLSTVWVAWMEVRRFTMLTESLFADILATLELGIVSAAQFLTAASDQRNDELNYPMFLEAQVLNRISPSPSPRQVSTSDLDISPKCMSVLCIFDTINAILRTQYQTSP